MLAQEKPEARHQDPGVVGGSSGAAALKGGAAAVPSVCWSELTIHVPRRGGACAAVLDPLGRFAREVLNLAVDPDDEFTAVRDVSGVMREGELVIVLGPAGSGRSALLRAISGRLNAAEELGGRLSCGGRTVARGDRRWRRATTYVSAEDDTHAPELTVFETLRFAATLNVGEERADEVVLSMLDTMGLAHVKDTAVGDAKLRGVSGGQKRRVTVGEMLLLRGSRFWFLDDMDRGLDGVTALGLVQTLRDACKGRSLLGASRAGNNSSKVVPPAAGRACGAGGGAMITLNSPSDEMLALADRLLVLNDQGQLAYFGSAAADVVRAHFAAAAAVAGAAAAKGAPASLCELVLQSVSGVSNSGRSAELFAASALAQELASELAALGGSTTSTNAGAGAADEWAPDDGDQERAAARFAQSRWVQLQAIAVRKSKLIARNPMTVARVLISALFAVFVASLFSVLPNTLIGAYSISGLVFLLEFIVLMLSAQVTIPLFFRERKAFYKHRAAELYHGGVFYFVNALLDLPLCVLEATILSAIVFLWVGTLQRGADCYFYLWAILVALEMVGQAMGRVVSLLSPTQIMATMVSTLTVLVWGSLSGYMPSYPGLPAWLKWANWLTPTAYGYEGLVLNNFVGLNISGVAIPTNGSGTLELGSVPGQTFLRALGQPRSEWGSPAQIMAFDLCMLFLFALLLDSVGVLVAELSRRKFSDLTRRRRPTVRAKAAHEAAETLPAASGADVGAAAGSPAAARPRTAQLAVRDLTYAVHVAGDSVLDPRSCFRCLVGTRERRVLLRSVDASFSSGRMTALMGSSGAGKTTLMDVIAGMKTGGSVEGRVLIDGRAKEERTWRRISAYGEQNDILDPYLSVWETLVFTARCCDATRSLRDTEAFVRSVLARLGLSSVAAVMVGKEGAAEGLAKHQRKRLTIAIALCQEPSILFLDEPTSGLALLEAGSVMRAVRDVTTKLRLVTLVTIHQPGAIFELFDDLLLLARGGRVAYAGPVGACGADALAYFGLPLDTPGDVSDRLLQAIDAAPDAAADAYAGSMLRADCLAAIQAAEDAALVDPPRAAPHPGAGFALQVYLLTRRQFVMILRDPTIGLLRLVVALLIAIYLGLVFYQIEKSIGGAVYLIAALFFFVQTSVIAMNGAVVPIVHGRAVLFRETRSGTYTKLARGVANFWAMLPFHAVCIIPASIIVYFMCGFERWGGSLGLYVCLIFFGGWTILAIGELYAYSTPVEEAATGVAGLTLLLSVCFMGFLVTIRGFPEFWVWANTANLFRYQIQGLTTNALAGMMLPLLPPGTNLSSGQVPAFVPNNTVAVIDFAKQVVDSLPGNRSFVPESPPIVDYINCLVANNCISQPYAINIPTCSGIPICIPRVSRCCREFQAVNLTAILQIAACIPGGPLNINNLTETEKLQAIWCVMGVILPSAWLPWIKMLANWLVNGIPGDVLLIYFGWTGDISFPLVDGGTMRQLTATTYTWYYPFFAVAMFLLGVELLKLVAIHIEWIKR